MKNILVINSGSSSLKFQLIVMPEEKILASGLVERIGQEGSQIHFTLGAISGTSEKEISNHTVSLKAVTELLLDNEKGVIKNKDDISGIAHRVVHGGTTFSRTLVIDEEVKTEIKALFSLAPLHNPPNLEGIEVAEKLFPEAPQVAVFDTAFHTTIPEKAYKYAIPNHFLEEEHIRLYGFHGTSHKYISEKAKEYLQKEDSKIISIHLGNGCSMTAVKDGKSIDHSMGFSPVTGLIMGTRSGDIDPAIVFYMMDKFDYTKEEVNAILQHKSGMYGLTGYSDLRDIEAEAENGNRECRLALEMNTYRIKKYIGSYAAAMNGLDAIIFTAGIGENSTTIRKMVCEDMNFFGIRLDDEKNELCSTEMRNIAAKNSSVAILVIPTNEELEIAKQAFELVNR